MVCEKLIGEENICKYITQTWMKINIYVIFKAVLRAIMKFNERDVQNLLQNRKLFPFVTQLKQHGFHIKEVILY